MLPAHMQSVDHGSAACIAVYAIEVQRGCRARWHTSSKLPSSSHALEDPWARRRAHGRPPATSGPYRHLSKTNMSNRCARTSLTRRKHVTNYTPAPRRHHRSNTTPTPTRHQWHVTNIRPALADQGRDQSRSAAIHRNIEPHWDGSALARAPHWYLTATGCIRTSKHIKQVTKTSSCPLLISYHFFRIPTI